MDILNLRNIKHYIKKDIEKDIDKDIDKDIEMYSIDVSCAGYL